MRSQLVPLSLERKIFFQNLSKLVSGNSLSESEAYRYCENYYNNVAFEDLSRFSSRYLAILLREHRALAAKRELGQAVIKVRKASDLFDEDAKHETVESVNRTIVQIVTEDMPFLVDSITSELSKCQLGIHLVVHPTFLVSRVKNSQTALFDVATFPFAGGKDSQTLTFSQEDNTTVESWIYLEIDRISDLEQSETLEKTLYKILEDVRVANQDWEKMRFKALEIAQELETNSFSELQDEAKIAQELLRWMEAGYFTFLGYREYVLVTKNGEDVLQAKKNSGLGILRNPHEEGKFVELTKTGRKKAREKRVLVITKANSRSTVHKRSYLDYVGVKSFDSAGNVLGERRFLGLLTATAYNEMVDRVPVVKAKAQEVFAKSKIVAQSHSGRDLKAILETYPRDEMFQIDTDVLYQNVLEILHLQERRRTRIFLRQDIYGRFVTVLVYLPRDRYNTDVRLRIETILLEEFVGESIDFDARLSESSLARLYFTVRVPKHVELANPNVFELEQKLVRTTRSWKEALLVSLIEKHGLFVGEEIFYRWSDAFSDAYKVEFDIDVALVDIQRFEDSIKDENSYRVFLEKESKYGYRLKIYLRKATSLTQIMPCLQHMGVQVMNEIPFEFFCKDNVKFYLYDFSIFFPEEIEIFDTELFTAALEAVWGGQFESDWFNQLIVKENLHWRQILVLRAYAHYLRQIASNNSYEFLVENLVANSYIAKTILEFFDVKFNPGVASHTRKVCLQSLEEKISAALDKVEALDADRILRGLFNLVQATLRTNFYAKGGLDNFASAVAFKIQPALLPTIPKPVPLFEVWVYSPEVEGVHLRFAKIARGGLRWSDRREDFRTEILGLVKAQTVKNAVIVPSGAKGGFYVKQLPDVGQRDLWLQKGIKGYKLFVRGLLDVTDNFVTEAGVAKIVAPENMVCYDFDDSYLVVAADKGTASFSDIANEISAEYNFWLGDAFASGGSVGYDHKKMGITARGAWESVRSHFGHFGVDVDKDDFTVVGIGDMSGDVFGNGMLLSKHIKLVAAFDHRHIFLDPYPNVEATFLERQRLYNLPRSSWDDFDRSILSSGGGVYSRALKFVPISENVATVLGIDLGVKRLTVSELVQKILLAPVGLLFNGGVGTYVKSSVENNFDVGDKANDLFRVDAKDLRVKVVGEGGNLGFTQLARVECASQGVLVNSDAIDNSAGVDCSDHEVNIKIFLDRMVVEGNISVEERTSLLSSMTGEVSRLVLQHNVEQNLLLINDHFEASSAYPVHIRFMRELERIGHLDRQVEFLPSDSQLRKRAAQGTALTVPELSVLVAYAKISFVDELHNISLAQEPWFEKTLFGYFPKVLVSRFGEKICGHPLRNQIVNTVVANNIINIFGATAVFRVKEETQADVGSITKAFVAAIEVFSIDSLHSQLSDLSLDVSTDVRRDVYIAMRRLVDRVVRWFIYRGFTAWDLVSVVERFSGPLFVLLPQLPNLLQGEDARRFAVANSEGIALNLPADIAARKAGTFEEYTLLDVIDVALDLGKDPLQVAKVYFMIYSRFDLEFLLTMIAELPRENSWESFARLSLRDDLYMVIASITKNIVAENIVDPVVAIQVWEQKHVQHLARVSFTLGKIKKLEAVTMASLAVMLRDLRSVI